MIGRPIAIGDNKTGASGAIPRESIKERNRHAELYYEEIRKRTSDVAKIANNTAFTEHEIATIKRHIFIDKHRFADGKYERFREEYEIAQTWQRLQEDNGTENDLLLLNHELLEFRLMRRYNIVYDKAHSITNRKYNWEETI